MYRSSTQKQFEFVFAIMSELMLLLPLLFVFASMRRSLTASLSRSVFELRSGLESATGILIRFASLFEFQSR